MRRRGERGEGEGNVREVSREKIRVEHFSLFITHADYDKIDGTTPNARIISSSVWGHLPI